MTPAEFAVLVDSRVKHYNAHLDAMDILNALNCQVTLANPDCKLVDFRVFKSEETTEQSTDSTVNVFKQWVAVTGGETR